MKSIKSKYGEGHNPKHKLRRLWSYRRQVWEEGRLSGRENLNLRPQRPDQDRYQIIQSKRLFTYSRRMHFKRKWLHYHFTNFEFPSAVDDFANSDIRFLAHSLIDRHKVMGVP
jgi:hypothetical protein